MIDETLLLEIVDNQGWKFPLPHPLILDLTQYQNEITIIL